MLQGDFFIDSDIGVEIQATGSNASMPRLINDGVIGNGTGVTISAPTTTTFAEPVELINSDVAFNTNGVLIGAATGSNPILVSANNIFWQNHSLDETNGLAMASNIPNVVYMISNMFANNGPNLLDPSDDTFNIGGGFNPAALRLNAPDANGNFVGNPAFVSPRDPRPTVDGPAVFFLDGNFDLTVNSLAIDRANPNFAPPTDILYRGRVSFPGRAFPGTGPADVGAYEFAGTGGIPSGVTSFHTVAAAIASAGSAVSMASAGTVSSISGFTPGRDRPDRVHRQLLGPGQPGLGHGQRPGHHRQRLEPQQPPDGLEPDLDRPRDRRVQPHRRLRQRGHYQPLDPGRPDHRRLRPSLHRGARDPSA